MKTLSPQKKIQESWGERIHYTGKRDAFIIICRSKVTVFALPTGIPGSVTQGSKLTNLCLGFKLDQRTTRPDEDEMGSGGRSSQHSAKDVGIIKVHK